MDKIEKHIDNVPVYRDSDFNNLYVKFSNWVNKYLEIDINLLEPEDMQEEYEHFEVWCENRELTPHKE